VLKLFRPCQGYSSGVWIWVALYDARLTQFDKYNIVLFLGNTDTWLSVRWKPLTTIRSNSVFQWD